MRPLGASLEGTGVRFRAYASRAAKVEVELYGVSGSDVEQRVPMERGEGGVFEVLVPGIGEGARYKLSLDGKSFPDPYARRLEEGVHGPAIVVANRYEWKHPAPARPLEQWVIYEIHVGAFTPEGTYAAARARLPELAALGVTAIELLPISSFAGQRGWGYDGVAPFAPFAPYGAPDDLRAFVDDAHALGLSMVLDVVYNHFGPAGNYLPAFSPEYFTSKFPTPWGDAPNFENFFMRQLVTDNARYWFEEFRFDGLRLDATHAIKDPTSRHVLADVASVARSLAPPRVVIAEDERNDPAVVREHGVDAVWADDFHHVLHAVLTGERDGYYEAFQPTAQELAGAIERGWLYEGQMSVATGGLRGKPAGDLPAKCFVYALQNHDQVGNRAMGERLSELTSLEALGAATMLLLFLPMTPLLFMGQEWGASTPFLYFTDHDPELGKLVSKGRRDEFKRFSIFSHPEAREKIPDPQQEATFKRSKLDWSERRRPGHFELVELTRSMLALRREDPVLSVSSRAELKVSSRGSVLVVSRGGRSPRRLLLVNLGDRPVAVSPSEFDPLSWTFVRASRERGWNEGRLAPRAAALFAYDGTSQAPPGRGPHHAATSQAPS